MKIKEINIVNFKGFQNETIRFNGNPTVVTTTPQAKRPC